ncbi:hypothetical protein HOLleu_40265 [Holothuria leucospilota]|uniref:Uncharacterized protein n=1 Tax=Holothuria leucospilota TaxID=206669 RepID=A0A9Q1BDH6_HOLLE|nr:hypothetical protein HOLleu_40265 [Holothuria leucospilota]
MLFVPSQRSKEMSQDDDSQLAVTFLPPVQGDNIPIVPTMEIYAMPISTAPDPTRPCSKTRAAEKDREMEQERMFFNRSRRLMVEKLRTIQMVLNALHNIKSRDLRSRVPLSVETVKVLFKDVAEKPFQRTVKDVHHSSNDTVNSSDKVPVSGLTSKTAIPARKASTMGRTEGLVSTTPTFQWRKHRQNIMHPKKELRVETWEDLVTMSSPSHGHRHSILPSMVSNPLGRWVGQHRHGDTQKLPLWQTVGVANEDKVTRPTPSTKNKNGTSRKHPDPEATLKSLVQNFTRVKKKLAREVHSDLERLLRYTDLKSGAENIVGKGDKEVNLLLQQLARFSLEDAKSIPNAKEKLCLLVMSMPASQLLTIPAQQALKYVLEEILWASSDCLPQWLNHRKIPMILQETSV